MEHLDLGTDTCKAIRFNTRTFVALAATLTFLMLICTTALAIKYRGQALLEWHAFRQTQTALTSYWACKTGFRLAYWTPFGGYPWSVPMEFPIYQYIVSLIACPLGIDLDPVGRLVSYAFWVACLSPAFRICKLLFRNRVALYFWTFAILFLSTPLYLFWGRSFLMETAALFFALYFVAFALKMSIGSDTWRDASLAGLFLSFAILQKSTTALPLIPVFGGIYLFRVLPRLRQTHLRAASFWKGIVAYVIPFFVGYAWVAYSDYIKSGSALGIMLTSSALMPWNFGTISARFSSALWIDVVWQRVILTNAAGYVGAMLIVLALIIVRGNRIISLASIALFLLYFLIFENLFFIHEYYPAANIVYLVFAMAVSLAGLVEMSPKFSVLGMGLLVTIVTINLMGYFSGPIFRLERTRYDQSYPMLASAKWIRERTSADAPILIYGDDYNSELPYYSQRRAFAVPLFLQPYLGPLDDPQKYLGGMPAVVAICGAGRTNTAIEERMVNAYRSWHRTKLTACDIYLNEY